MLQPLDPALLPPGVRARFVPDVNGLTMHMLEAGYETQGRPCLLLLHGFPELAWSWRNQLAPLAAAGFHVVAPDQRGYGRTTGWDASYDADIAPYRMVNLARDAYGLVSALGYRSVAAVIGHDFGSPVAAWCALLRPDVFRAAVLMSAPFAGPPRIPFDTERHPPAPADDIQAALARLPRPRKHYVRYYATRPANEDMWHCRQGVHAFLRAYYHHKSADWPQNRPHRLGGWTAEELARLPTYYVMDLDQDMPATVAPHMPMPEEIAACRWLPEDALRVYSDEYSRTGFQGGLNWYRGRVDGTDPTELQLFSGRSIDVPSMFIAGAADWGVYQLPGAFEAMQQTACSRMVGCHLVDGAGHWVQQEQPDRVTALLLDFLRTSHRAA